MFLVLLQCYPDNDCTSDHNMFVTDNMWKTRFIQVYLLVLLQEITKVEKS